LKRVDESQAVLFDLLTKTKTNPSYLRSIMVAVPIIEQLNNSLSINQSIKKADEFIQKVLDSHEWNSPGQLAEILMLKISDEQAFGKGNSVSLKRLKQVIFSKELDERIRLSCEEIVLRATTFSGNFDEASSLYHALKKKLASQKHKFADVCLLETSRIRAIPSFSATLKSDCKIKSYPQEVFTDMLASTKEVFGENSEQYAKGLLWAAQFEFCMGNEQLALQYLNQIMSRWTASSSCCYLPAENLASVIKGSSFDYTKYKECVRGTKNELLCQQSLLESSGHIDASKRCRQFGVQLVEK
ncbi:MAG: hypothetical protein K2X81_15590, partial [Candidatus Obscuribacterales bacterium]|nr:hypothetical protein [Candidatus Obscuribacterales bacterium]